MGSEKVKIENRDYFSVCLVVKGALIQGSKKRNTRG